MCLEGAWREVWRAGRHTNGGDGTGHVCAAYVWEEAFVTGGRQQTGPIRYGLQRGEAHVSWTSFPMPY